MLLPQNSRNEKERPAGWKTATGRKSICEPGEHRSSAPRPTTRPFQEGGRSENSKPTCRNWSDRISALAQSTGRGTFLIDPGCQDILWLDVPRASFPLHLGGNRVAIKRHPLGRLFYSSDQPGAGSFTIDGLPGDHKGRCFFVFWRRDGDCLLRLIGLVRFIDPEGREIAAPSPFGPRQPTRSHRLTFVSNDERTPFHRVGLQRVRRPGWSGRLWQFPRDLQVR